MGVSSNLEVLLPETHLDPKLSSLVKPTMEIYDQEFQASTQEDHKLRPKQQLVQQEQDEEQQNKVHPLGLKIKIPSYKEVEVEKDDSNDGFKTPTSKEHKIPVTLPYPPTPRKPKPLPSTKRKRCRPHIPLDLSQEIESFFSTVFGPGGKNKKVKLFTN